MTRTYRVYLSPWPGKEHNFNKYSHGTIDRQQVPYDFNSIMHYGKTSFSKNGKPTIRSIHNPDQELGQRIGFTDLDIHEINTLYDCSSKWKGKVAATPHHILAHWKQYSEMQYNTTQHNTTQHNTTQHNTTQQNTAQHSTAQHRTAPHRIVQHTEHRTARHSTAQHSTAQHSTSPHCSKSNVTQHNTTKHYITEQHIIQLYEKQYFALQHDHSRDVDIHLKKSYKCCSSDKGKGWSNWSRYGACDKSCFKIRQRFCTSNNPDTDCPGHRNGIETEDVKCSDQECNG